MNFKKSICLFIISALCFSTMGCSSLMLGVTAPIQENKASNNVIINEAVSSNSISLIDEQYYSPDWLELYNPSNETISLEGYGLSTSRKGKDFYEFGAVSIDAGGYLIVYCADIIEDSKQLACGFNLSKKSETVFLSGPQGDVLQELKIPELEADISYGLSEQGEYVYYANPTPGAKNQGEYVKTLDELKNLPQIGLEISEVLPKSSLGDQSGDLSTWVELFNNTDKPIELDKYFITDNPTNKTKARLPKATLEPKSYYLIHFSDSSDENALPFGLNDEENAIYIYDGTSREVDNLAWNQGIFPDTSVCKQDDKVLYCTKPTPGAINDTQMTETAIFDLIETTPQVRINEILRKNEFSALDTFGNRSPWVELYNAGDTPVSLASYSISDDMNKPWKWRLPDVVLKPNSYILIFLTGKDIHEPQLHSSFKLSDTESTLTLSDRDSMTRQAITFNELPKDNISYGIDSNGDWMYYALPTPLAPNETKAFIKLKDVEKSGNSPIQINEVASVSAAKSGKGDWIELYNSGDKPVDLTGFALSDSKNELARYPLAGTIAPSSYALVKSYNDNGKEREIKISHQGESIYLSDEKGVVVDIFTTTALRPSLSCGWLDGHEESTIFLEQTPGAKNSSNIAKGFTQSPILSHKGGFFGDSFTLEISSEKDAQIYYTLDGSMPSKSANKYESPIKIDKSTPFRAIATKEGFVNSDDISATYLKGQNTHTLPIVCINVDQADLSYVFSSTERKDEKERRGMIEYYEDNSLCVSFPAGLRIAGNGTRGYAQKSINLYIRGGYGRSGVTYPFFGDETLEYKSLSLRNMGQDIAETRMRDAYFSMAVDGMNISNAYSKFAVAYINGKYWGLYELKENQNEDYFAMHYDVPSDDVVLVRSNTHVYNGHRNTVIKQVFETARGNTNDDAVFKKFSKMVDTDAFIDYLAAQSYFANSDAYNQKYAGTNDFSFKYRPIFYDLDWGHMDLNPKRSIMGSLFSSEGIALSEENRVDTGIYNGLFKNSSWRERFVDRYIELLNTQFSSERLLSLFDSMYESIKSEMPRTIQRWGRPSSMSAWEADVANLRKCIAERRPYAVNELARVFNVPKSELEARIK